MGISYPKNPRWPPPPPPPTKTLGSLIGAQPSINALDVLTPKSPFSALTGPPPSSFTNALAASAPFYAAASDLGLLSPNPAPTPSVASPYAAASDLGLLSPFFGPPTPASTPGVSSLFGAPLPQTAPNWRYVRDRFNAFLANLALTSAQREDGNTKQAGVRACLNRHYWGDPSETANSLLIGSWGKDTQVRPPRDVDVLFLLPPAAYHRFQEREGNRQSQLLQEVKNVLLQTYPQTTMRGDRQVIVIPFSSTAVELSPGFLCLDGRIIVCDTNDGGRYYISTAEAEERELSASDLRWSGNTRALVRMLKQWQREHDVPLKSFVIERLAVHFLDAWYYSHHDVFWYDWMIRDFFRWLLQFVNGALPMPGGEIIPLGNEWQVRAQRAYQNAISACDNEHDNYEALAGNDWQKIFGMAIPVLVP